MMSYFLKTVQSSIIQQKQSFSPGLLFYVYIESPNPKNPEGLTPQDPNPINFKIENPNPNNSIKGTKPQNPNHHNNEQKYENITKNKPGKKYSLIQS